MKIKDTKLTSGIVIEMTGMLDMPDPQASEQAHYDALFQMNADPIKEDLEEDPMKGQGNNFVENEPVDKDVICLLEDRKGPQRSIK